MTPCDIIIKSEYENWCRSHKQDPMACWAQERNELRAERDTLKLQVGELKKKIEDNGFDYITLQKHADEGWKLANTRTSQWKDAERLVSVFRSAFRARYAVQLHEADCRQCAGEFICLKGQKLRQEANAAEEKAGEADTENPKCGTLRPEYDWCSLEAGHDGEHRL